MRKIMKGVLIGLALALGGLFALWTIHALLKLLIALVLLGIAFALLAKKFWKKGTGE